jgi:putative YphP/YqiW family bacilliredoxin
MMYDPELIRPMREELTSAGFRELKTPDEVNAWIDDKSATGLLVINSVCGCAAGMARPGVRQALQSPVKPDRVVSVFAGQDLDATAKARSYFADVPPSSPSMALFKDGELVWFLPRHRIENRDAMQVADDLISAFEQHCAPVVEAAAGSVN